MSGPDQDFLTAAVRMARAQSQTQGAILNKTLADGDYKGAYEASAKMTASLAILSVIPDEVIQKI